jgi:hypothetical protein
MKDKDIPYRVRREGYKGTTGINEMKKGCEIRHGRMVPL